jgi:hypothetical protein
MKINVELDCTPEEMRTLLGLPDVKDVNKAYVEGVKNAMSGATSIDQLQNLAKNIAPMGEMGMRFFQNLMEAGTSQGSTKAKSDKSDKD